MIQDEQDTGEFDFEESAPVVEMDPIEEAIVHNLGHRELLYRVASQLARMAALMGWIRENPEHYTLTDQLDISRAIGRRQRALLALVATSRAEAREAVEVEIPPAFVDHAVGLLREKVIEVLREVAPPEQATAFECRLDAAINGSRSAVDA